VDRNTAGAASTYGVDYRTSDLSDDGRYVSFASYSPDIASLPMNFVSQVYRFDRVTGETALVSIAPDGMPADNSSYSTSISGDGRFVAVMTIASNLAQPAPPGTGAVVVRDMAAAGNVRVDLLADDLPLNHFYPYYVTISADGTAVAFSSDATNAGRGETGNGVNAFVATGLDAAPRAASFTTAGGSASLAVTVSRVAGWDAQSLADWIEITDGNGFGAGPRTVRFSVGPNRTGGARQAGIRLGSTVVAVHQAWDPDAAPVTPTIAWAPPAPIVYGTALGGSQLNAAADTAGTFSYSPAAGTLLGAGTHTLTATFTPRDPARFTTASATTTLVVERATPVMTWNPAGALVYGMPLGAAQLNATASTSGEIAYRPAAGSLLHAGAHAGSRCSGRRW
jgi:hypothetical protein